MNPFLIFILSNYIGLGLIISSLYIREVTKVDTWQNLKQHRRLFFKATVIWPYILWYWFVYNSDPKL